MKGYSYEITLDINESQSPITLPIKVGDRNRKVCISLRKGSEPYVLEKGTLAYVTAKQNDETYGVLCGVINGKIFCDFSALVKPAETGVELLETKYISITNSPGVYDCELVVYRSEDGVESLVTASRFTLIVDPRLSNGEEVEFIGYPYEDFAKQVSEYLKDYDNILFKDAIVDYDPEMEFSADTVFSTEAIFSIVELINVMLKGLAEEKEDRSNKVTEINENSTDEQYASAKAVYDYIQSVLPPSAEEVEY